MKKVLFLLALLFLYAAGLYPKAGELNIYASGLRVTNVNEETNIATISYVLNCEADALEFQLINSTGVVKTIAITGSDNLSKGQHNNVEVNLSEVTIGGIYKWALKATRPSVNGYTKVTDSSTPYEFWGGRGVAVDNSFESDFFGNVYVTNFNSGGGVGDIITRLTQTGVYAFDAELNMINEDAYQGGLTWGTNSGIQWAIARPCVGPDGTVYISVGSATNSGVWMMNPANPATFTPVFGGTHSATGTTKQGETIIHNSILHCYVEGDGASRKLYTYDLTTASVGGDILRYDIGNLASPWNAAPSATIYDDATNGNKIQGGDCSIAPDGNGGWWICQYRSGTGSTAVPCLIHTTNGIIDYNSGTTILTSQQGGLAVSNDGSTLAIGTDKSNIIIYDVSYAANNTPTLTKRTTLAWETGRNAKGLAFDVAKNLYAVDNAKEMFAAWATKGSGEFTTPAPSSQKILISRPLAGTYKIGGAQADYTSLFAATADINQLGISADVTLLICDNLTEQVNPVLTNGTEHSITIRPDADADRKISFTAAADNYGPSGAFIIGGVREIIDGHDTIAWNTSLTNNIHIDGFAEDGTTRRLTFDTPTGHANTYPILIYGNVHDSYIKNCIINCTKGSGTRAGIIIRTAKNTNTAPQNILIENNLINPSSIAGQGIMFNGSQASTKGIGAPKDCIIRNNRIEVQNKGIYLNGANGLTIENNDFLIAGANGMNAHAIMGDQHNRGDIIIRNNKFNLTTNNAYDDDYGVIGVASSGLAAGQTIQWTIENNYFGGLDAKNASASSKKFKMMYIRCANPTIVRHNTFHIPAFTKSVGMDLVSAYCASAVYLASSSEYFVQNNIFVCEETNSKVSLIRGALNTNIRNNIFYHAGGNGAIVAGATVYNTYNDLPEAYKTTYNNKNIQVAFSDTYKFTDECANNFNLGVERIEGLNYDIEGNVRNYPTRAGCYDPAWCLTLDQTATDNTDLLTGADGIMVDAVIKRSFGNDGWYTLVLPFDATVEQLTEVFGEGYKVAVLKDSRWKSETDMYLNFAPQATIEAGVPCLIKPATSTGSEIVFHNVTIDKDLQSIETDVVDMIGLYNQTTVTLDADNYYLGNGNLLYEYNTEYASSYALTNGFRAYFHFNFPLPAGCSARVIFREDTATEIEDLQEATTPVVKKVLRDEQLIIIRDGKEYNVQGQLVR